MAAPTGPMAGAHPRDADPYDGMRQRRQRTVYDVKGTPAEGPVESGAFFEPKSHPAQPTYAQPPKQNGKSPERAPFIATSKPGRGSNGFIPVMRTVPSPGGKYIAPERRLNAGDVCFIKGRSHEVYRRFGWTMDRSQDDGNGGKARDLYDQQPDKLHNFSFLNAPPKTPITDVTTPLEAQEWEKWFNDRAEKQRIHRESSQAAEDVEARYSARNSRFTSTALSTDATVASLDEVRSALDALVLRRRDGQPMRHCGSEASAPYALGMIVLRARTLALSTYVNRLKYAPRLKVANIPPGARATELQTVGALHGLVLDAEEEEGEGEEDIQGIGKGLQALLLTLAAAALPPPLPSPSSPSSPPVSELSTPRRQTSRRVEFRTFLDNILGPRQPDASNALRNYLLTISEGNKEDPTRDIERHIYGAWLSEPAPKSAASGQLIGGDFLDPIQLAAHIVQALGYTPDGVIVWSDEHEMASGHFTRDALAYNVAVQGVVSVNNGAPCPDPRRPPDRALHGRSMEPLGNLAHHKRFLTNADLAWNEHRKRNIPEQSFDPLVRVRDQIFIGMYCATAEDDEEAGPDDSIRRSVDSKWTSKANWMRWWFENGKQKTARYPDHGPKLRFFLKPLSSRQMYVGCWGPEDATHFSRQATTAALDRVRSEYAREGKQLPSFPIEGNAADGTEFLQSVDTAFRKALAEVLESHSTNDPSGDNFPDPDAHLLVGAWQIGSVMDSRAVRPAYDTPVAREFGGVSAAFPTTKITACVNVQWVDAFQLRYRYGTSGTHWTQAASIGGIEEGEKEMHARGVTAARTAWTPLYEAEEPYDARPRFWPLHEVDECLNPARAGDVAAKWTNQAIAMEMVERNIGNGLRQRK